MASSLWDRLLENIDKVVKRLSAKMGVEQTNEEYSE